MNQDLRTAALLTAAALRDDEESVRMLAARVPPDRLEETVCAAVTSMAALLRLYLSVEMVQHAIVRTQRLAHQAAQEGTTP
ncbi:MAG: hypothetical protein K0R62_8637 [Nonomuraea muscovyensis]|jgi:hypothetical protein|nr:hypothetical protein [Nonomuraea muscovyensis]